ncbi:MAG: type II toxin-antitoxin system HicB family antitoxin [Acidobacteriota bacterium]
MVAGGRTPREELVTHVPDLPGWVAVGEARDEVPRLIREAIDFHIEGLTHDTRIGWAEIR